MTVLAILELLASTAQSIVPQLTGNPALAEILSDVEGAISGLTAARDKAATLAELESLRTKPMW